MILISSAAYIEQDLALEVGRLPPAFLPIGNKRLFEHQIELLKTLNQPIYLSLPESYKLSSYDEKRLTELAVKHLIVPDGLTLGNSVLFCWSATGVQHDTLTILHGDTLFFNINMDGNDFISTHINTGAYSRAKVNLSDDESTHYNSDFVEDEQLVLSGLFNFSRPQLLMQGILYNKGDFIGGIEHYTKHCKLNENSTGSWLDFGHLNSFFRSRSLMTTQRAFNDLIMEPRTVTKSSTDKRKMLAESNWFKTLPRELSLHIPALLCDYTESEIDATYILEYLYLLPLNDLLVFGRLSDAYWRYIFQFAFDISQQFSRFHPADFNFQFANEIYLHKTLQRINKLRESKFWEVVLNYGFIEDRSLESLALQSAQYIEPVSMEHVGIVHGDYCFSNILFDSRTQALKLIDPRGIDSSGNITIYGDRRYDIAKLYHSVVGCYDFIIAGRYQIKDLEISFYDDKRIQNLELIFDSIFFKSGAFNKIEILAINIHLFISMLPLHADQPDRQKAMLLNAWRLYQQLYELKNDCNTNGGPI